MQKNLYISLILIISTIYGCKNREDNYLTYDGFAQGSTYHIVCEKPEGKNIQIGDSLIHYFHDIDFSVSGYNKNSLLSALNRGEVRPLDQIFIEVFNESYKVYKESNGYFDVSAAPLFDIWGFGFKNGKDVNKKEIDSILTFVGMDKVRIIEKNCDTAKTGKIFILEKDDPRIQLNFNAIAQGYTCDYMAKRFQRIGINNYLIEIGGEVICKGVNQKGEKWRVGIDKPIDGNDVPGEEMQCIINISNKGLVTSGNYRKYFIRNGKKYSHTIDPKTGYPVQHSVLSATVVASDATTADAYATYFMVIGLDKAKEVLKQREDLQAYIIFDKNNKMQSFYTDSLNITK